MNNEMNRTDTDNTEGGNEEWNEEAIDEGDWFSQRPVLRKLLNLETGLNVNWEAVFMRIHSHPMEVRWQDPLDQTTFIFEALVCDDIPTRVVQASIEVFPEVLHLELSWLFPRNDSNSKCSLLQFACLNPNVPVKVVEIILNAYPDAALKFNPLAGILTAPVTSFRSRTHSLNIRHLLSARGIAIFEMLIDVNRDAASTCLDSIMGLWEDELKVTVIKHMGWVDYLAGLTEILVRVTLVANDDVTTAQRFKRWPHKDMTHFGRNQLIYHIISSQYAAEDKPYSRLIFDNDALRETFMKRYNHEFSKTSYHNSGEEGPMFLHCAIKCGLSWRAVHAIYEMNRSCASLLDPDSRLYPFALASIGEGSREINCLNISYTLLKGCPSLVSKIDCLQEIENTSISA